MGHDTFGLLRGEADLGIEVSPTAHQSREALSVISQPVKIVALRIAEPLGGSDLSRRAQEPLFDRLPGVNQGHTPILGWETPRRLEALGGETVPEVAMVFEFPKGGTPPARGQ